MASDAAPRDPAEEKPRELTKEDFVAPSIDWGDTVVRNADASSDDAICNDSERRSRLYWLSK